MHNKDFICGAFRREPCQALAPCGMASAGARRAITALPSCSFPNAPLDIGCTQTGPRFAARSAAGGRGLRAAGCGLRASGRPSGGTPYRSGTWVSGLWQVLNYLPFYCTMIIALIMWLTGGGKLLCSVLLYRDCSVQSSIGRPGSCANARSFVTRMAWMLKACEPIRRSIGASTLPSRWVAARAGP